MLRILLADDHDIVRRGLRDLFSARDGWTVCGEARTGREAVEEAARLRPHVVVLDLDLPEMSGIDATREIRQRLPETEVLVFSMYERDDLAREALACGVRGYVLESSAGQLVSAVETVAGRGRRDVPPLAAVALRPTRHGRSLTAREREIVRHLADGASNKQAAAALGISVKTVETHRAHIMRKLGLGSFAELVRYAVRQEIVRA